MRVKIYQIVFGVMEERRYSDEMFHHLLEQTPDMESREKRFVKRIAYGAIERAVESDAFIRQVSHIPVRKLSKSVRTVLRIAIYEIRYMDSVPEAVSCHEAVELLKKVEGSRHAGFVNGVLRSFLRGREEFCLQPWEELSLTKNLYEHLVGQYGKKTTKKMADAFLGRKSEVTLHIDTNKISVARYEQELDKQGVKYRRGRYHEDALIVERTEDIKALAGYEKGWFFVQDESSMLPVRCADIQQGDAVIDICAAPGGKTIHALVRMNGRGQLVYRDVSEKKLSKTEENIDRMGYVNACGYVWDATKPDETKRGQFDVLLADVPCSGIGIIGKKPEIKYRAMQEIDALVPIQRKICRASVSLLRKGGIFLYSTCTVSRKENEENVIWLEECCGLRRESLDAFLPDELKNKMTAEGMLQMLPGLQESDGFFLARLRKV